MLSGIKPGMQIADAQDHFMIMNEHYRHQERIRKQEKMQKKIEARFLLGSLWNDGNHRRYF